jgi:arginine/lysine/ornithine decarboxylase
MKENRLSDYYGVFCIAIQLEQNHRELDVLWDKALKLYDEFKNSEFNNPEKPELECINEFLKEKL